MWVLFECYVSHVSLMFQVINPFILICGGKKTVRSSKRGCTLLTIITWARSVRALTSVSISFVHSHHNWYCVLSQVSFFNGSTGTGICPVWSLNSDACWCRMLYPPKVKPEFLVILRIDLESLQSALIFLLHCSVFSDSAKKQKWNDSAGKFFVDLGFSQNIIRITFFRGSPRRTVCRCLHVLYVWMSALIWTAYLFWSFLSNLFHFNSIIVIIIHVSYDTGGAQSKCLSHWLLSISVKTQIVIVLVTVLVIVFGVDGFQKFKFR